MGEERSQTVEQLEALRATALAKVHRYERRARDEPNRAADHRQVAKRARKFADEVQERITVMRRAVADEGFHTTTMIPPEPGWTLRAFRTLTLNGQTVPRGTEISAEQLSQMANAPALLSGGHIRWMPPSRATASRPVARDLPPSASAPVVLRDVATGWESVVVEAHDAIAKAAAERGVTRKIALDLIPSDLLKRAYKSIADTPRIALARTGWDGINPTPSGQGTLGHRRIVDDASTILTAAILPSVERVTA
jgi:hypothetical protein